MAPPRRAILPNGILLSTVIRDVCLDYLKNDTVLSLATVLGVSGLSAIVFKHVKAQALQIARERKLKSSRSFTVSLDTDSKSDSTTKDPSKTSASKQGKSTIAVNKKFFDRIKYILKILLPSPVSKEAIMLIVQFFLLLVRSLISLRIAKLSGDALQAVAHRSWRRFYGVLADFFISGVAASIVNSGLKYLANMVATGFRETLTKHVHSMYTQKKNYYKAAVLMQLKGHLDNADQRIVADLDDFCKLFSDLYGYTFKPALDVLLCTMQMARTIGFRGPIFLYAYFVFIGGVLRAISPPFSKLLANLKSLEGDFRRGHSRLIANAEEVAFLNGSHREEDLLNQRLTEVTRFRESLHLKHFRQGLWDQYGLKYFASMLGFPVLALPFLWYQKGTASQTVAQYKTADALIQQACRAVGDLILVYKKLQTLAGYTARVAELLEAIEPDLHDQLKLDDPSVVDSDEEDEFKDVSYIKFNKVSICAPDGRLLIKDLDLLINSGQNVLITGPNGAGKTSLFRVLASLWHPSSGIVIRPKLLESPSESDPASKTTQSNIFYVPQKPYLVAGTLRDQILYPFARSDFPSDSRDHEVIDCLTRVGLKKLITPDQGLDIAHHDWADVLSGGEKQRIGLARLYFHKPRFAVLDEATSAINADEEGPFYHHLGELGITIFSIAHRLELRRFHTLELTIAGDGKGNWSLKELPQQRSQPPLQQPSNILTPDTE